VVSQPGQFSDVIATQGHVTSCRSPRTRSPCSITKSIRRRACNLLNVAHPFYLFIYLKKAAKGMLRHWRAVQ